MFLPKKLCPVPFDQQPLNEYMALKKSCFFAWSILEINIYVRTICYIFLALCLFFSPLVWLTLYQTNNWLYIILYDTLAANCVLVFIFIRLYLGWSYVIKRLVSATVFYEESGWYDGQIWIKTIESLTKDRLIGLYEVSPYINRIKYSLLLFIILFLLETFSIYLL
uniref:Ycf36 n=1 Tax=Eucheuma denticulatum TaxID=305493 RepID=A0A8E7PGC8_9FLOR|nr:hypothetical protein [Eucheuma denticulatum]